MGGKYGVIYKRNKKFVINVDEPYIDEVTEIMKRY